MHEEHVNEAAAVLKPAGEIDLGSSRALAAQLAELAGDPAGDAVLDLSRVTFMDSVGLGVVVKAANRFSRQGKRLHIVAPDGPVRRLIELAGLDRRLRVAHSFEQALGAAGG
jgi:anti-anti-sigma factor